MARRRRSSLHGARITMRMATALLPSPSSPRAISATPVASGRLCHSSGEPAMATTVAKFIERLKAPIAPRATYACCSVSMPRSRLSLHVGRSASQWSIRPRSDSTTTKLPKTQMVCPDGRRTTSSTPERCQPSAPTAMSMRRFIASLVLAELASGTATACSRPPRAVRKGWQKGGTPAGRRLPPASRRSRTRRSRRLLAKGPRCQQMTAFAAFPRVTAIFRQHTIG
jgi:hypothetical protein